MNKQVKIILNEVVNSKMGITLFNEKGQLCYREIKNMLSMKGDFEDEIEDGLIIKDAKDENIYFEYNEGELSMYVPKELKEQIIFSIEYLLSEFDKVNDGINDLAKQFNINRIATIKNAEDVLLTQGRSFSSNAEMSLYVCRNNLGEVLHQLQMDIMGIIDYIYNIPTGGRRIFKIKVSNVLEKEKRAHISLMEYIKGIGIYAEISMKLGDIEGAEKRVNDALEFLNGIEESKRMRIEGWNQKKDMFWIQEFSEYGEIIKNVQDVIKSKRVLRIGTN